MTLDPKQLSTEVDFHARECAAFVKGIDDQIARYTGPAHRGSVKPNDYDPEAVIYETVSLMMPKLVYSAPRVFVKSRLGAAGEDEAHLMEQAWNRWIADTKYVRVLELVTLDALFRFGVLFTTMRPREGFLPGEADPVGSKQDVVWIPRPYRISPKRYVFDTLAETERQARFRGHKNVRDRSTVLREAKEMPEMGWNVDLVKRMTEERSNDYQRDLGQKQLQRDEIAYWEIHVPEYELEESPGPDHGFNGTLFTIPVGSPLSEKEWLRKPMPFYGPPTGGYSVCGFHPVTDDPFPLAPFVAGECAARDVSDSARALNRNMRRRKKIVLVDKADPELGNVIKTAVDGGVYGVNVDGIRNRAVDFELGVPTEAQVAALQIKRDRADRIFATTEAKRGNVTGIGTASENVIANEASNTRIGYMQRRVREFALDGLTVAGWYLYHGIRIDEEQRTHFPLGDGSAFMAGAKSFVGGYDAMELEIGLRSMEMQSQEAVAQETNEIVENVGTIAQMPPWVDQRGLADLVGRRRGWPELPTLFDPEKQAEVMQAESASRAPREQGKIFGAAPMSVPPASQGAQPVQMASFSGGKQKPGANAGKSGAKGKPALPGGMSALSRSASAR